MMDPGSLTFTALIKLSMRKFRSNKTSKLLRETVSGRDVGVSTSRIATDVKNCHNLHFSLLVLNIMVR
jgi:hypothetical protein